LGTPRHADKKAVKAAYFELVNVFHPDRYYRKNLGSFKNKLEKVFARLTVAHDTLTRAESRAEYDAYLAVLDASRDLDRALSDPTAVAAQLEQIERQIEAAARAERPSPPILTPIGTPRIASMPPGPPPEASPATDPDARRRALARKLGASASPPRRISSSAIPVVNPAASRDRATGELQRMHEQRKAAARTAQLQRYLDHADEAMRLNQPVGALNALRIAASLSDDPKLALRLAEVEQQAYVSLSKTYTDRGEYEFKIERFAEAARSFRHALRGSKTAHLHARIAQSLLAAGEEPRSAVEHAREAVSLAPNDPSHHVTLGRAYLAAGLKTSGIGSLERAAALDPTDATIQDWLQRAKRGEVIEPAPASTTDE
jgi:tetratricopeptide (TPR) repeat protein